MLSRRLLVAVGFAGLLAACNETPSAAQAEAGNTDLPEAPDDASPLTPAQVLTRASLDIRGIRPTEAELDAVEADPQVLDDLIDGFVDDPAFGERIEQMFAGAWRTRIDTYPAPSGYAGDLEPAVHAAIGDEPLHLVAYIALNDLPFTEIVRAEDTFVDPVLTSLWPLETLPADGALLPQGTVRARYVDGRPLAGVLSMNSVFWRHGSTIDNANRGRANALSEALLCQSWLDRPIDFPTDLDLTDSESIRHAIEVNQACQACHSTMDPLASYLWGFMYPDDVPRSTYSIPGERGWQQYTGVPPGFFGLPGERLEDLGNHIAADERFVACTVRRVYEALMGRPAVLADEGALAEHREAFLASDLSLKSLVRSILRDPSYRGLRWTPRFGGDPEPVSERVAPIDVLAGSLTDLTGYTLALGGRPAARLDFGVRSLAGGSDRGDATDVSTGAVLVQRRLAEAGAIHLVDRARAGDPSPGRLGSLVAQLDPGQPPTPETVARLVRIARSKTLDLDDPELVVLVDTWHAVARIAPPHEAWVALLTAILADPDHLLY